MYILFPFFSKYITLSKRYILANVYLHASYKILFVIHVYFIMIVDRILFVSDIIMFLSFEFGIQVLSVYNE